MFVFYDSQISGGGIEDIKLSSFTLFPNSIRETFRKKLRRIFAVHFRPDPNTRTWKMHPYEGQTVSNLIWKCQLVLSLVYGGDAAKITDPANMCHNILLLCKHQFPDHYFMRQRLGI